MNFKYWVDNRDIRDRGYKGPVILPYDEMYERHQMMGKMSEEEALNTIKSILKQDIPNLEDRIENQKRYLAGKEAADKNLIFEEFYSRDFYFIMEKFIKEGYQFELIGEPDFLTVERLKWYSNEQRKEIWEEGKPYVIFIDLVNHVSISELVFKPIYERYKDELGWFWDKDNLKYVKYKQTSFKYYSLEEVEASLKNCKLRLNEIEAYENCKFKEKLG